MPSPDREFMADYDPTAHGHAESSTESGHMDTQLLEMGGTDGRTRDKLVGGVRRSAGDAATKAWRSRHGIEIHIRQRAILRQPRVEVREDSGIQVSLLSLACFQTVLVAVLFTDTVSPANLYRPTYPVVLSHLWVKCKDNGKAFF